MITIIQPSYYWPETTIKMFPFLMGHVERCGRICYKSEKKITLDSAERFVKSIRLSGHESVLEHATITTIVVCSRACSHQWVRHRIAAYSMESMRYVNYGKQDNLKVICPPSIGLLPGDYNYIQHEFSNMISVSEKQVRWIMHIDSAYEEYKRELKEGVKPEDARYLLPNATKTELAVTFNLRQWRHFFKTRCDRHAQWEIRNIANSILVELTQKFPAVFEDLYEIYAKI